MLMALVMLTSCAHVISRETLAEEEKGVSFRAVRQDFDKYKGKLFVWGGVIVHSKAAGKDTLLEILQVPLDEYGGLTDTDASEGRFIARFKEELDPIVYEEGRSITVAGTLTEKIEMNIAKERPYSYPVLDVKDYYLWRLMEYYPYHYTQYWWFDPQKQSAPWWYYQRQLPY